MLAVLIETCLYKYIYIYRKLDSYCDRDRCVRCIQSLQKVTNFQSTILPPKPSFIKNVFAKISTRARRIVFNRLSFRARGFGRPPKVARRRCGADNHSDQHCARTMAGVGGGHVGSEVTFDPDGGPFPCFLACVISVDARLRKRFMRSVGKKCSRSPVAPFARQDFFRRRFCFVSVVSIGAQREICKLPLGLMSEVNKPETLI